MAIQQGFPNISNKLVTRDGFVEQAWLQFFISLWQRTGSGPNPPASVPTGGTGQSTLPNHELLVGRDTSPIGSIPPGTTGEVLTSNGPTNDPSFQTPAFTGTVTSVTAGTGLTGTPNPITVAGTIALTVPVTVPDGGTGDITLANHAVLLGQGASPIGVAVPSTSGFVLTDNGAAADPSFQAPAYINPGTGTTVAVAGTATLNFRSGKVTSEALVAATTYTLVLTNSFIVAGSVVLVNLTDSQGDPVTLVSTTTGSGSVTVVVVMPSLTGTVLITFGVFN